MSFDWRVFVDPPGGREGPEQPPPAHRAKSASLESWLRTPPASTPARLCAGRVPTALLCSTRARGAGANPGLPAPAPLSRYGPPEVPRRPSTRRIEFVSTTLARNVPPPVSVPFAVVER